MSGNHMYMKDDRVWTTWRDSDFQERSDGLVLSRYDLNSQIGFINDNHIEYLYITLGNPRIIVDREFREAAYQLLQHEDTAGTPRNYDIDLASLRDCPQLARLSLEGNLLHSDALRDLPCLRTLDLDFTLGTNRVDLSGLSLQTLYLQKPGQKVYGYEMISSLQELAIWNYQPKSRNLSALKMLQNLERLMLVQPRIDTLVGIEYLPSLSSLEIYRSRTLHDTSALDRCTHPVTLRMDRAYCR